MASGYLTYEPYTYPKLIVPDAFDAKPVSYTDAAKGWESLWTARDQRVEKDRSLEEGDSLKQLFEENPDKKIEDLLGEVQKIAGESGDMQTLINVEQTKANKANQEAQREATQLSRFYEYAQKYGSDAAARLWPSSAGTMPPIRAEGKQFNLGDTRYEEDPVTGQIRPIAKNPKKSTGKDTGFTVVGPDGKPRIIHNNYDEKANYINEQGYKPYPVSQTTGEKIKELESLGKEGGTSDADKAAYLQQLQKQIAELKNVANRKGR